MKPSSARLLRTMMLVALGSLALAANASVGDLTSLTGATPADDWAMKMWRFLFGDFADHPFTPGAPTTLMGTIMLALNTAVFTLGIAWTLYGVLGGVVQTAHEGEILGKAMSTVWYPIRAVIGVAGMVPVFGGFTLFQAIMMFLTVVGIGIGNAIWTAGTNATSSMQALINQNNFVPSSSQQLRRAVHQVFVNQVCVSGEVDSENQLAAQGTPITAAQQVRLQAFSEAGKKTGYRFGSSDDRYKCGHVTLVVPGARTQTPTAFRTNAVDYQAIADASFYAHQQAGIQMVTKVTELGAQWYNTWKAADANSSPAPEIPVAQLDAIADGFAKSVAVHMQGATNNIGGDALAVQAKHNMTSVGWMGAGAWFSTFAEVNAAIADAAKGPDVTTGGPLVPTNMALSTPAYKAYNAVVGRLAEVEAQESAKAGDPTRAILDSAIKDSCTSFGSGTGTGNLIASVAGTATGNCSLGQSFVSAAIRASAVGSGGGGNGNGTIGPDSTGLVNPIIVAKNVGDYAMTFSSTMLGMGALTWIAEKLTPAGKAAGVASTIGSAVEKVGQGGKLLGEEGTSILKLFAVMLLVAGAAMSLYIPFIPFILWIGGVMAYITSVIEGLVGASLHAMSHLDTQGEGMGQRTAHGYIFWLNVAFRPALMVIGFFAAAAVMIGVGTFATQMFLPAMANVQGNSLTGFFSIIGFMIIFGVILITTVSSAFHIPFVLTDQVLGFLGNAINSHLGREVEDKVHSVFMLGARMGPQAIGDIGRIRASQAEKGAGAGAKPRQQKTGTLDA